MLMQKCIQKQSTHVSFTPVFMFQWRLWLFLHVFSADLVKKCSQAATFQKWNLTVEAH